MDEQDWKDYYEDEAHQADLREERRKQIEDEGPYDEWEFCEDDFEEEM